MPFFDYKINIYNVKLNVTKSVYRCIRLACGKIPIAGRRETFETKAFDS